MKKPIMTILLGTLAVLVCGVSLVACLAPGEQPQTPQETTAETTAAPPSSTDSPTQPAEGYNTASVPADGVQKINIDWVAGSITLVPGDTEEIVFQETYNPDRPMIWEVSGTELEIQYADYDLNAMDRLDAKNFKKDLTITVPRDWTARKLEINAASSNVEVRELQVEDVEINCVSGRSRLENCVCREVSLVTVSGDVRFTGTLEELDCSAVSADCTLRLDKTPRDIELYSVSGGLDLELPEDSGFQVEMTGARKKLNTDFDVSGADGSYLCGDGSCQIEVNCVTSRVKIHKN